MFTFLLYHVLYLSNQSAIHQSCGLNGLKPFPIESSPQLQHWLDLFLFWLKKARSTFWLFVKSNIKRPFLSRLKRKFEISILEKIWGLWKEAWFGQFSYEKPLQELVGLIFETKSSFHFFSTTQNVLIKGLFCCHMIFLEKNVAKHDPWIWFFCNFLSNFMSNIN